ncbi:hypothetical protein [Pontibacillus yanchengensis]|uniref:Hydrolase n=1 Tax=Pontibacillus yanchengensis Y32 TaxID=1385514 RepID=A0A0A2T4W0_9BACI|nr:hypothetical protein [Pontibacillus yanchengensis]KGP70812.1 hypothetical protein N782_04180 [Pontibacillus yanchengensis Y32]
MSDKKPFYVNLGSREISQLRDGNNDVFKIEATEEDMFRLRQVLNEVFDSDERSFWRAHVPYRHYSQDMDNDEYDSNMRKAYQMIYEFGDEETRKFIKGIGMTNDEQEGTVYGEEDPLA